MNAIAAEKVANVYRLISPCCLIGVIPVRNISISGCCSSAMPHPYEYRGTRYVIISLSVMWGVGYSVGRSGRGGNGEGLKGSAVRASGGTADMTSKLVLSDLGRWNFFCTVTAMIDLRFAFQLRDGRTVNLKFMSGGSWLLYSFDGWLGFKLVP
jgi:hypothetical protein